ncbi:MAG: hypothetical protein QNL36_02590 [Crocinitomicaceae bacterium]|nr:hypothetical protein [Crocinitomicaceae bacterium]
MTSSLGFGAFGQEWKDGHNRSFVRFYVNNNEQEIGTDFIFKVFKDDTLIVTVSPFNIMHVAEDYPIHDSVEFGPLVILPVVEIDSSNQIYLTFQYESHTVKANITELAYSGKLSYYEMFGIHINYFSSYRAYLKALKDKKYTNIENYPRAVKKDSFPLAIVCFSGAEYEWFVPIVE